MLMSLVHRSFIKRNAKVCFIYAMLKIIFSKIKSGQLSAKNVKLLIIVRILFGLVQNAEGELGKLIFLITVIIKIRNLNMNHLSLRISRRRKNLMLKILKIQVIKIMKMIIIKMMIIIILKKI